MDWGAVAVAAGGVLTGLLKVGLDVRARGGRRSQIQRDVELLSMLPEDSAARAVLSEHVDRAVSRLIEDESEKRRDWVGVAVAVALLGLAAWIGTIAVRSGGSAWWWAVAGPLALIGAAGLGQDAVPRKRDERGRPLPDHEAD